MPTVTPAAVSVTLTAQAPSHVRVQTPAVAAMSIVAHPPTVLRLPGGGTEGGYQVRIVDKQGQLHQDGALYGVSFSGPIAFVRNDAGGFGFQVGVRNPKARAVKAVEREAQVWRNGRLLFFGPIARTDADARVVNVQCREPMWYFDHRNMGRADRNNLLVNGNAEYGDLNSWVAVNTTAIADTSRRKAGAYAFRLEQSAALQDAYLTQVIEDYGATGVGSFLTLAFWYYIDPDGFIGEAIGGRGVDLRRLHATSSAPLETAVFDITGDTSRHPRGTWLRGELGVHMPADAIEDIQVKAYSLGGRIWFDEMSLTLMESVSSVSSADDFTSDMATMIEMLVAHGQDPAFGKSNLNIATNCPPTGLRIAKHYQLAEHEQIGDAIRDYPREGGPSFRMEYTPSTRTLRSGTPHVGTHKAEWKAWLYDNGDGTATGNVLLQGMGHAFDGEAAVSSATILAQGDGPDREEGGYIDAAAFGGTTMEVVEAAPPSAEIDTLDRTAEQRVAEGSQPEELVLTYITKDVIGNLWPDDTIDVDVDYGYHLHTGVWRVERVLIDPSADTLTAACRPA